MQPSGISGHTGQTITRSCANRLTLFLSKENCDKSWGLPSNTRHCPRSGFVRPCRFDTPVASREYRRLERWKGEKRPSACNAGVHEFLRRTEMYRASEYRESRLSIQTHGASHNPVRHIHYHQVPNKFHHFPQHKIAIGTPNPPVTFRDRASARWNRTVVNLNRQATEDSSERQRDTTQVDVGADDHQMSRHVALQVLPEP